MAEKKEKQYVSDDAQLMAEWDFEKNSRLGFDPTKTTRGCSKKVWWKCKKEHSWEARVVKRTQGQCCPICREKKFCLAIFQNEKLKEKIK